MYRICVLVMAIMAFLCGHQTRAAIKLSHLTLRPQPGNKVSCQCRMSAGETFVAWLKPDGSIVPVSSAGTIRVESDGNEHTIRFTDVKVEEGGNYKCRGSSNEKTFVLQVAFDTSKTDLTQHVSNGQTGTIEVNVPGYPKPEYIWKKENTKLSPATDARYTLRDGGSLEITNVRISDQGNYTVSVRQDGYEDEVTIDVYVVEFPQIEPFPTSIVYLTEGQPASFVCKATGRPSPKYQWLGPNGQPINSLVTFQISGGNLTVTTVARGLIGKYTCRAYNEIAKSGEQIGEAKAQVEIKDVYVPPKIVSPSGDVVLSRPTDLNLECKATGYPVPTVEWKKNGERDPRQEISAGKSVIKLKNIQVWDGGRYSCEARNSAVDSKGNAIVATIVRNVNVESKPYIIKQASPGVVYSYIGNSDPTYVTCTFGGYPEPWVIMRKNKKVVSNATTTANVTVITDSKNKFGIYHCSAKNDRGITNQTVELKVAGEPSQVLNFRAKATCDCVELTWNPPLEDGGMPINKFVLQYKDNTRNIDQWKRSHTICDRKPATDYTFVIRATNKGAWGPTTNVAVKTQKYCVPGRPIIYEPSSSSLDETSFTLKWRRPEETGGDDEIEYIVRYRDESEDNEMPWKTSTTKETEYDIKDLEPQKRYKFEVFAKNKAGQSSPDERYFIISQVEARSSQFQLVASYMVIFTAGILHLL